MCKQEPGEHLDKMLSKLGELLDTPCNFGFDDYMFDTNRDWCENHCGSIPPGECWRKLLETKIGEEG